MTKKRIIYVILMIFLLILLYTIGCKFFYGEIYLDIGNKGKNFWDIEDLQDVSKEFEIQDNKFLSISADPWFLIEESFQVRTIVIDISEISGECQSQVFYFSASQEPTETYSYHFQLKQGLNYLQVPKGDYNRFRLDLSDRPDVSLDINSITTYGCRRVPFSFLAGIVIIWLLLANMIHILMFQKMSIIRELFPGCLITLALCFMLFLYAPLELFFSNWDEFWFDVYTLLPILSITFLTFTVIGIGILGLLYRITPKMYQAGVVIYCIVFLCSYIQGTFLISNLPPLDGTTVDWGQYMPEQIVSVFLWIAVTVIVLGFIKFMHMEKFYKAVSWLGVCISFMLLVALISVCVTNEGYKRKTDSLSSSNALITDENLYEMSQDTNFIILVLDALDARSVTALMDTEPGYKDIFSDFTYYPNMVGGYSFTMNSIPFILSGDWFENEEPFKDYNKRVYEGSRLFSELEKRAYKLGVYETEIPVYDADVSRFDNIRNSDVEIRSVLFAELEIKLTGFKYAPFGLKKYCMFNVNQFNELRVLKSGEYSIFNWSDLNFYDEIQQKDILYTKNKCFKFIHLEGAHVPFQYDKNLNIVENGTYEGNVEACMTITKAYLEKLKESEVYDNSVILVMSDHGYDGARLEDALARHNPAFFVKGIREKHDMYISKAPISYEDLQEANVRLLEGRNSTEIFDWKEGDQRERRYFFYHYTDEDHMIEYMINGDAADESNLIPTGREYNYVPNS